MQLQNGLLMLCLVFGYISFCLDFDHRSYQSFILKANMVLQTVTFLQLLR